MAKKERNTDGGSVLTTRRMPSGAQQYVRPREDSLSPRMDGIRDIIARRNPNIVELPALLEAMIDESDRSRVGRSYERQTRDEDNTRGYADGGMVRGCKAGQMSGKKFSGSY